MDFRNIGQTAFSDIVLLATTNTPLTVPFWAAVLWLMLLVFRKEGVRAIWRSLHLVEDLTLQKEFFQKVDVPLRLMLLLLATMPFLGLIPSAGSALQKFAAFVVPILLVHIIVQAIDISLFEWYLKRHREANIPTVFRFVVIGGAYVIFALILLDWMAGVNVVPLLATSTVVTAVMGLALQDTLRNLFAGLTMSFEKRLRQGDWIMFRADANNSTVGEVTEIGWRTTKIRTPENNFAIIPNALFTTNSLVNYSQPSPQIARSIDIPVSSLVELDHVLKLLIDVAQKTKGVLKEPPPEALAIAIRNDHIDCRLKFWVAEYVQLDAISSLLTKECFHALNEFDAVPVALPDNMPEPHAKGRSERKQK